MSDINFASEDRSKRSQSTNKKSHADQGDVEYTSGARMNDVIDGFEHEPTPKKRKQPRQQKVVIPKIHKQKSVFGLTKKQHQHFFEPTMNQVPKRVKDAVPDLVHPDLAVQVVPIDSEPEDHTPQISARTARMNTVVNLFFGSIIVVLIAFVGVNIYQRQMLQEMQNQKNTIEQLDESIAEFVPVQQEATQIQQKIYTVEEVMNTHVYWSPFMTYLYALALPTVEYISLQGSAVTGEFTLVASAPDTEQLTAQLHAFQLSPHMTTVELSEVDTLVEPGDSAEGMATVTFDFVVDPRFFHRLDSLGF